ncbi:MAG: AAA family ATPase [Sulfurimonas sp.]|uniref:AAA family ATPase n=1 Tax=Sulfurimonas sp. TaxID=2022749 RepID=UPI003D0E93D6
MFNIKEFLSQDKYLNAFITGPAGSGKTTKLAEVIEEIESLKINYLVVAYTHKAKEVLISKLPTETPVKTLHSWLKKRPGINEKATNIKHLMTNHQKGRPETLELLIVDEFSFVGEKDYLSIRELQDDEEMYICPYCEKQVPDSTIDIVDNETVGFCFNHDFVKVKEHVIKRNLHVLYVGDLNQLSPIDGPPAVNPHKPYWHELKTIYRNNSDGLQKPLNKLIRMMEGYEEQSYIEATTDFIRNVDIDSGYKQNTDPDKIMLAFTNEAVQKHNAIQQGRANLMVGDIIWNNTFRREFEVISVSKHYQGGPLVVPGEVGQINELTKYNPIKTLVNLDYITYITTEIGVIPSIFGFYTNKTIRESLGSNLVNLNKLKKDSKEAYKIFKCVHDYVSVIDFNHCLTIHKSQGSEYNYVYIDTKDLTKCLDINERMKLLYVAISRSKNKVFVNN